MVSTDRSFLYVLLVAVSFSLAMGCSTAPDAEEDEAPLEKSGIEDLVQSEDVLVAARLTLDDLSSLTPMFQRLAQTADDPVARELADISPDPIGHLESAHDMPNELSALAQDRSSYMLFTHRGNGDFFDAASLGLIAERDEWPAYFNLRVLLPTADTEKLQKQAEPWLEELVEDRQIGAYEVYDGPDFVRLELAVANLGASQGKDVDADKWLADLNLENVRPPAQANYRETPAYTAFIESDAGFGIWAPVDSFGPLGALELLEVFAAEHDMIGEAGQPQHYLEGVARVAAASVASDPVVAESEDLSVVFDAGDDGALMVDYYTSRTQHGIALREAMDRRLEVAGFATDDSFLNLTFQGDTSAVNEMGMLPHWSRFEDDGGPAAMGQDFGPGSEPVEESVLPFSDDPALFPLLTVATQYPRTAFATTEDTISNFIPMPRALALESFVPDGGGAIPLGAAAVAVFDDSPETRMAIEQLLGLADGFFPGGEFDAELFDRDDDLVELHVAFGADLDEVFDGELEPRSVYDVELSLNLGPVQQMAGMMPGSEALEMFDRIHLRGLSEETYQAYRLTVGTDEAGSPEAVDVRTEPRQNPSRGCRNEMAALAVEHLADLRGDSMGMIEAWAKELRELASECLEADDPRVDMVDRKIERTKEMGKEIP